MNILSRRHSFDPTDERAMWVQNNVENVGQFNMIFGFITAFIVVIGIGSLDVDFLDPSIAPEVATTVRGGPTYREAQLCMEMIADTGRLASLDVMELNPALDERNRTANVAVDLIGSLFGKSTLMRR